MKATTTRTMGNVDSGHRKEIQKVIGRHKSASGALSLQEHINQSITDNFYCSIK
jgi:hypothetical protein